MITFWDISEKERAGLTREEVERFLDAELMTKGVLKVAPLVLDEEPAVTDPPAVTYYQVGPVAFTSAADAERFLSLAPVSIETKYLGGGYRNSLNVAAVLDREIHEKRLVSENDFATQKSNLDKRAAVRDANAQRSNEHQEACKAQDKVLDGVWQDWFRCRNVDETHRRVVATFNDYVKTAGDEYTAARFLGKVFTFEQIDEARKWCVVAIPDPDFPMEAPEPVPAAPTETELCF